MRVLELYCGVNKSVGTVAKALGLEVTSVDINPKAHPDLLLDIQDFDETAYPKDYFQFIWASPPCESYSRARSKAKIYQDEAMQLADSLLTKTRQIIAYFGCPWCIENPATSKLWMREVSRGLLESSCITSYCCFGMQYRKDTRIANSFGLSLPRCPGAGLCPAMIGSRHKEYAQKGRNLKKKGAALQCNHTLDELHSIPSSLCRSVLAQVYRRITDRPAGQAGID